jgi:hypothetical protein
MPWSEDLTTRTIPQFPVPLAEVCLTSGVHNLTVRYPCKYVMERRTRLYGNLDKDHRSEWLLSTVTGCVPCAYRAPLQIRGTVYKRRHLVT